MKLVIWSGCNVWLLFSIPMLPYVFVVMLWNTLSDYIKTWRRRRRDRAEKRKWAHYPQYPNGTLITGRMDDIELEAGTNLPPLATTSTPPPNLNIPHLPPEIIRDIIRYATDTYPFPASRHCPPPSSSSPHPTPPLSYPPFPYSSANLGEDTDVDRRLHILSMKIKLAVSRVSRTWRDVAVEFLFNSIRVEDSCQIPLLWRAFAADATRRGVRDVSCGFGCEERVGGPGSAGWWVRELWFDSERYDEHASKRRPKPELPAFGMMGLLRLCPNIVVFRGIGRCASSGFPRELIHESVVQPLLHLVKRKINTQDPSQVGVEIPDSGQRVAVHLVDPFPPFYTRVASDWLGGASSITLYHIVHLELSSIVNSLSLQMDLNVLLPNLTHLSIWGVGSLVYAGQKLEMPALRSVVYGKGSSWPRLPSMAAFMESFLIRNGSGLEELTVLDATIGTYLTRIGTLCPILTTFRAPFVVIPLVKLPSVTTLGLYGLERFGGAFELGEVFARGILQAMPNLTVIQDASWRSGVIRRRAYTNWRDPEGARRRRFWMHFLNAIKTGSGNLDAGGSGTELGREVEFVDWRGREVEPVPACPQEDEEMVPDSERLLEAVMDRASFLRYTREP